MQPKTPKLLDDLRDAAAFIRQVTSGKTLEIYRADRLLRQAVERNFEIIGEAVTRLASLLCAWIHLLCAADGGPGLTAS